MCFGRFSKVILLTRLLSIFRNAKENSVRKSASPSVANDTAARYSIAKIRTPVNGHRRVCAS